MENINNTQNKKWQKTSQSTLSILEQGKLPPQSLEVEAAVLGALLLDSDALLTTIDFLKPEFFYKHENQVVFNAILELTTNNQFQGIKTAVDPITVTEKLKQSGKLQEIGGPYYIAQLTNRVASSANIEYYARIVAQNYIKRELISIGNEITTQAYSEQSDIIETLDGAQNAILEIGEKSFHKEVSRMDMLVSKTLKELEDFRASSEGKLENAVYTGFTEVDRLTQGFQPGQLVICGARPGMGKNFTYPFDGSPHSDRQQKTDSDFFFGNVEP